MGLAAIRDSLWWYRAMTTTTPHLFECCTTSCKVSLMPVMCNYTCEKRIPLIEKGRLLLMVSLYTYRSNRAMELDDSTIEDKLDSEKCLN
uniref:Uncharacterized protein n=1 Tax=Romanomermis culicivorax TaxID=13658 RepID=A0A915JJL3_ROMCU